MFVPDRVFDTTCRFVAGEATSCPWAPSGSWSIAITSAFVSVVFVAFDKLRRSFPARTNSKGVFGIGDEDPQPSRKKARLSI